MAIRLQKYLAQAGVASRRKAETLISDGQVAVNGQVVRQLGSVVEPTDKVTVNGKAVKPQTNLVYYALNKPKGVITTSADEQNRKKVIDLVPRQPTVVACGRLDAASRGLVIISNDGDFCYQLTHPKFNHEKEYLVTATINHGPAVNERIERLKQGVMLDDGRTSPAKVAMVKRNGMELTFSLTIHEGKNRQIRRMCSAVGLDVIDLVRTRVGQLTMTNLPEGRWKPIRPDDVFPPISHPISQRSPMLQ